jgi:hypothetical protein
MLQVSPCYELARPAVEIVERLVLIYYKRRGDFGSSVIDGTNSWLPNRILEDLGWLLSVALVPGMHFRDQIYRKIATNQRS